MKTMYVFWQRLKQYYIKNKGVFQLFILGGMLNAIIVSYCYGNLIPSVSNRYLEGPNYMEYLMYFHDTPPSVNGIEIVKNSPLIRSCILSDGEISTFDEDYPIVKLNGTFKFTDTYQVIVPSTQEKRVGEFLEIYGKSFEIIGISSSGYYISEDTFMELVGVDGIRSVFVYAAKRQPAENDLVDGLLREAFPNMTYLGGPLYDLRVREARDSEGWMVLICVQAFVAVVAYAFLLRYMLGTLRKENVVSMILGSSKVRTAILIFRDAIALCVLANAMGLLTHYLLYKPIFRGLNIEQSLRYTFNDYCLILLMMVMLSLIVTIPVVIKEIVSTPANSKRRNLC